MQAPTTTTVLQCRAVTMTMTTNNECSTLAYPFYFAFISYCAVCSRNVIDWRYSTNIRVQNKRHQINVGPCPCSPCAHNTNMNIFHDLYCLNRRIVVVNSVCV